MIWILIAILASLVLLAMCAPFILARKAQYSDGLGVFAGQMAEVQRDRELGLIDEEEASVSEREIKRRLLNSADAEDEFAMASGPARQAGIIVSAIAVIGAFALYMQMGSAHLVGQADSEIAEAPEMPAEVQQVLEELDALAADLMANPENPRGWAVLGQAYLTMGRYDEAAVAFENAINYTADSSYLFAALGQAYLFAERGRMTPRAREAFARALDLDPLDPRARFFVAEAEYQSGDRAAAMQSWQAILDDAPADAEYRTMIEDRLEVARQDDTGATDE